VASAAGAQSNVTLSPFVTLLPDGNPRPMAGLAFAAASGPFALRASAQMSTQERAADHTPGSDPLTTRPWAADADALVHLDGLTWGERITFKPFVFSGVSTAVVDSGAVRKSARGWSYGTGLALPLGAVMETFAEWRWRMSRFVLPNATDAPAPTTEVRLGLSFRVGSGAAGFAGAAIDRVLSTAGEYIGTPYQPGGNSPSSGFDAAGFVRFVFARFGVILPRSTRDQAQVGERVDPNWRVIAPGDLVLFEDAGSRHVAIYAGKNQIIHSSESGGGVRYDDLSSERGRWFLEHLVAVRRVTPDLRGLLLDLAREFDRDDASADAPDRAPRPSRR
jgi:cell wall-associated NlpC family hydrolase